MLHRFRERFGTAGVVIAVIALVAALGGTALAAGALTGKQKREVEKIAKKFAGKPGAPGTPGAAGTNGTNGKDGTNGTNGKDGTSGDDGDDGVSVTGATLDPGEGGCVEGGVEYTAASGSDSVCNGEEGSPWTAGGTLPGGETETGAWSFATALATLPTLPTLGVAYYPLAVSFPIPLGSPLGAAGVHYIAPNGKEVRLNSNGEPVEVTQTKCEGSSAAPSAKPGNLCIYQTSLNGGVGVSQLVQSPGKTPAQVGGDLAGAIGGSGIETIGGTGNAGAVLYLMSDEASAKFNGSGAWAVTAP